MKKIFLLAALIVLCAWGYKGHRAVALIAQKHFDPNTSAVVAGYLNGEAISDVSTWADDHRNPATAPWHYINLPLGLSHEQFVREVKGMDNTVYSAILKAEATLKDKSISRDQKNEALKFLIHLIGDAHQPMHVSREEDKGGNDIQVRFDGKGTNLHALWDSKLIDHEGLSEEDIVKKYDTATPAEIKQWQADAPTEWLWESYQVSSELYTNVKPGKDIDQAYFEKYIPIIHKRIDQAGIRLAGELNRIFADEKPLPIEKKVINATPVKLEDIQKYTGTTVKVSGKVYGSKDIGSMVLVNLGGTYPNQLLTVALKGSAKDLAKNLDGKTITIIGEVIDYKGKPEIIVTDPSQITDK